MPFSKLNLICFSILFLLVSTTFAQNKIGDVVFFLTKNDQKAFGKIIELEQSGDILIEPLLDLKNLYGIKWSSDEITFSGLYRLKADRINTLSKEVEQSKDPSIKKGLPFYYSKSNVDQNDMESFPIGKNGILGYGEEDSDVTKWKVSYVFENDEIAAQLSTLWGNYIIIDNIDSKRFKFLIQRPEIASIGDGLLIKRDEGLPYIGIVNGFYGSNLVEIHTGNESNAKLININKVLKPVPLSQKNSNIVLYNENERLQLIKDDEKNDYTTTVINQGNKAYYLPGKLTASYGDFAVVCSLKEFNRDAYHLNYKDSPNYAPIDFKSSSCSIKLTKNLVKGLSKVDSNDDSSQFYTKASYLDNRSADTTCKKVKKLSDFVSGQTMVVLNVEGPGLYKRKTISYYGLLPYERAYKTLDECNQESSP